VSIVGVSETVLGIEVTLALRPPATVQVVESVSDVLAVAYRAAHVRVQPDAQRADRVTVTLNWATGIDSVEYPDFHHPVGIPANPLEPIPLGLDDRGSLVTASFYGRSVLVGGSPGSGKSNAIRVFLGGLANCRNVALYGCDPKHVELSMWEERFSSLVLGNEAEPAQRLLTELLAEVDGRARHLRAQHGATLLPSSQHPWIVLIVDEWAEIGAAGDKKARDHIGHLLRRYVALGRAVGCTAVLCTQRPTSDTVDTGTRSLLTDRFALRCGDRYQADSILPPGSYRPEDLLGAQPGRALWSDGGPARAVQFYEVPDSAVLSLVQAGFRP
jgi:S-DNA-T family DNA segregation ATPase FtsK/SpoIIIE